MPEPIADAALDPKAAWDPYDPRTDGPFDLRRAAHLFRRARLGLAARWITRIVEAPFPLVERLTLMWHDHFATSLKKVRSPRSWSAKSSRSAASARGRFESCCAP